MFINLHALPKWVLEKSDFLQTLLENDDGESNEFTFIPFLTSYDESYDFGALFQREKPYLDLDRFLIIYYDGLIFLDFIGFQIDFYQLIEPKFYQNELIAEFKEDLKDRILGVQHYGLRLVDFANTLPHLKSEFHIHRKFVQTVSHNHHDWMLWFIQILENYDFENPMTDYIEQIFHVEEGHEEDFRKMSVETFDLLKNKLFIQPFNYPSICENIVKSYHFPLFEKYHVEIRNAYEEEALLSCALRSKANGQMQIHFLMKMFEKGFTFHRDHAFVQALFASNNVELYKHMHTIFYEKMKNVILPIHKKLYELAIRELHPNMTFQEKRALCDFFIEKYPNVTRSESFIRCTFENNEIYKHQMDNYYDKEFMLYVMEASNHLFERSTYKVAVVLNMQNILDKYHAHYYNPSIQKYEITAFRDQFRMIIKTGKFENMDFYIRNRLYVNDSDDYKEYLVYGLYHPMVFKYLYEKGFQDINDRVLQEAFDKEKVESVIYIMQKSKYKCTPQLVSYMRENIEKMEKMRGLLKEKKDSITIQLNFNEAQYKEKKKIYEILTSSDRVPQ